MRPGPAGERTEALGLKRSPPAADTPQATGTLGMIRLFHSVAGLVALSALLVLGSGVQVARAATALTVQGVRLERTAGGRRVYLALSGQPDAHAEFQLGAPPRLVIDLAGTVPNGGVPTARFPLGDEVVAGVRVSPHEGRLRAVVDLTAPAGEASVRCEGSSVIAELRTERGHLPPARPGTAMVPPPTAASPVPAPIAAPARTSAAPALRDVQVETTATGRRVRLEFSRVPDAERHFMLDDPKRFVVDVTGSPDRDDPVRRYAIRDPVVTQVRSGARDGGLRAVVNLGAAVKPTRVWIEGTTVVAELDIDTARPSAPGRPGDLVGRRATVTGTWANGRLQARRVRFVEGTTPASDEVTGRVDHVDQVGHRLRIGGVVVEWTEATRFTDVSATGLAVDMVVAVSGRLTEPGVLVADTIEPDTVENDEIVLKGVVADEAHDPDDTVRLGVFGIPVVVGRTIPLREATLTRRLDERRPAHQLTVSVFDRPLTIGGEVEVSTDTIWNPTLVRHTRDWQVAPLGCVDLELTYPLSRSTFFFLEGVALYGAELSRLSDTDRFYALERGESWAYLGDLLGSDFALQIGRQNVRERRAWWWDRDLDAARLYFDRGRVHAEIRVGEELFSHATDASDVDADEKGVLRVFSNVAWGWSPGQRLDFFGLGQWDRSGHPPSGTWVDVDGDDPSDADLVWLGGRTSGRVPTG